MAALSLASSEALAVAKSTVWRKKVTQHMVIEGWGEHTDACSIRAYANVCNTSGDMYRG